jgi:hypothetical protein
VKPPLRSDDTLMNDPTNPWVVYNHWLPVINFSLGKDTHWHSTKIFMKSGARS